jgi:hypothetical protein
VQGDRHRSQVNGVPTADFRYGRASEGSIGIQVYGIASGTGPRKVRWKGVTIRELSLANPPNDRPGATSEVEAALGRATRCQ